MFILFDYLGLLLGAALLELGEVRLHSFQLLVTLTDLFIVLFLLAGDAVLMAILGLLTLLDLKFELLFDFFVLGDERLFSLDLAAQLFNLLLHRGRAPLILLNLLVFNPNFVLQVPDAVLCALSVLLRDLQCAL